MTRRTRLRNHNQVNVVVNMEKNSFTTSNKTYQIKKKIES